jgi:hypothetical protein
MKATMHHRLGVSVLAALGLGLLLTLVAGTPAWADEEYGDGEVVITVTISELDLCEQGLPGCDDGGVLGSTGLSVATPLGAGVLAVALGLGGYALGRRRRDPQA